MVLVDRKASVEEILRSTERLCFGDTSVDRTGKAEMGQRKAGGEMADLTAVKQTFVAGAKVFPSVAPVP